MTSITRETGHEPATCARIVEEVCRVLSAAEVARAIGVGERSVQNWRSGRTRPRGEAREGLLDLYYLVEILHDVYKPEGVGVWLRGRSRPLGGRRALEVFASAERERVLELAATIREL